MATTRKKAETKSAPAKKSATKSETTTRKRSDAEEAPKAAKAAAPKAARTTKTTKADKAEKSEAPKAVKAPKAAKAKPEGATSQRVALAIAAAALDKKAVNVEIIDVAGKVDYADFVVVMSGTSDRQVNALARGITEDVHKATGQKCLGVEGLPGGAWVLMDFGDVVVHIFHQDVRGYYDLESLWLDAARLPVPGATSR